MLFDARFFPDFLAAFLLEALPLVEALALVAEALALEVFVVEGRLLAFATIRFLPAFAATRFLVDAARVFLLAAFFVLFLAPRELVDFFEADRPLLDFFAADLLPAFFVAILPSVDDPAQYG